MSTLSTELPTSQGPGSVAGAPNPPEGVGDTFTGRYIDTSDLRLHAVRGGDGPPLLLVHGRPQTWNAWRLGTPELTLPILAIGGAHSPAEQVADTMKLVAEAQILVIPGCAHGIAEETLEKTVAALNKGGRL
jgi:pimeloyl-ACP methyl ester carboxylesterase